jgi:hypothetical protein
LEGCPQKLAGSGINNLLRYVGYAEKGQLPVAGGVLDQSQWFLEACELVMADQAQHRKFSIENMK